MKQKNQPEYTPTSTTPQPATKHTTQRQGQTCTLLIINLLKSSGPAHSYSQYSWATKIHDFPLINFFFLLLSKVLESCFVIPTKHNSTNEKLKNKRETYYVKKHHTKNDRISKTKTQNVHERACASILCYELFITRVFSYLLFIYFIIFFITLCVI